MHPAETVDPAASSEPPTSTSQLSAIAAAYVEGAEAPAHHPTRRELREHGLPGAAGTEPAADARDETR
jgi:HAE1 family hydrophobic/amphiphilic exporter-1